ncbi:MAG TPA: hypothetical protein VMM93_14345 [Vicinamibacterales bacterium]|nr:hypothetical protein [Vicinamibacterales bacterium]
MPYFRVVLVALTGLLVALSGTAPRAAQSDLDQFMRTVLARRDENWKKLQQYILDEREVVEVRGPGRVPIWGEARDYSWFIREGFFVRSPVKANGVNVSEQERRRYEDEFLTRARARDIRERERAEGRVSDDPVRVPDGPLPGTAEDVLSQVRRPQFMDAAYFLKFTFEEGKYAFVGRESFEGRDVLRIEYYPSRLFDHEQESEARRRERNERNRSEDREAAFERMFNKVSLVTLWIEPASHQIVKYTFDNVHLDFLPAAWLVRITDLNAVMTMSQPFSEVWLPRDIEFRAGMMFAVGPIDIRYRLDYRDYREALTSGRIKRDPGRP